MRRGLRRGLMGLGVLWFLLGASGAARAAPNVIDRVTARAEGQKTLITVHGSATPSFTAYRLERPARVVVDLADGRFASTDGPIDVDSWAVGQIATAQYAGDNTRTARVMIGFKRPSTYDVRAQGHNVIITVTSDQVPPAEVLKNEGDRLREDLALTTCAAGNLWGALSGSGAGFGRSRQDVHPVAVHVKTVPPAAFFAP